MGHEDHAGLPGQGSSRPAYGPPNKVSYLPPDYTVQGGATAAHDLATDLRKLREENAELTEALEEANTKYDNLVKKVEKFVKELEDYYSDANRVRRQTGRL